MKVLSPITNSTNICKISSYEPSITSDSRIEQARVDNYVCLDSGLVFNASGARGEEKEFYSDEYDLHSESSMSEFKYFESGSVTGIYDDMLKYISENVSLSTSGKVLDIGCGKGIFLRKFAAKNSGWSIFGVEPSRNAQKFFQETLPIAHVYEGVFEDSGFINQKFDLITANGVLEHVPAPVEFLRNIRKSIAATGSVYIGVPNFKNNPADLFTYDHLSRFTTDVVKLIVEMAGFEILNTFAPEARVPMWFILKPAPKEKQFEYDQKRVERAEKLVEQGLNQISSFFRSFENAAMEAKSKKTKVAMYGSGAFGLIGTRYTALNENMIEVILDDNPSVWGSQRLGIKVDSPANLKNYSNVSEIVISCNPCYLPLISDKIERNFTSYKFHKPQLGSHHDLSFI